MPEAEITERVGAALRLVDLPEEWRSRRSSTLSGGEKQLVALAACFAQEAPIFVADEPTAHLAPVVAARLHQLLMENQDGRSVFLVDHRLDGLIASVDRVVVLGPEGGTLAEGEPASVFGAHRQALNDLGVWLPLAAQLDGDVANAGLADATPPLTVDAVLSNLDLLDGREADRAVAVVKGFVARHAPIEVTGRGELVARLVVADCAPLFGPTVLRNITLDIHAGKKVEMLGANGAGKSTLGASLAGLLKLKAGRREGKTGGIAFQNPENQFIAGSVIDEIAAALPVTRDRTDSLLHSEAILRAFDLAELRDQHPFELSQGQKRRLSLATLTAAGSWPLFVLDEPTAGLDARGAAMIAGHIEESGARRPCRRHHHP